MAEDIYTLFEEDWEVGDGAHAWLGLLLVIACGFTTLGLLIWAARSISRTLSFGPIFIQ